MSTTSGIPTSAAKPAAVSNDHAARAAADLLGRLRGQGPLVHNITNYVSMDVAANALLAMGASPAMVHAIEEVEEFVAFSSALVINIGTLSTPWIEAMVATAAKARALGKPWVLDPVGAGATGLRNRAVERLMAEKPTLVRGNASEIMAVAGMAGAGKGVDSGNSTDEARDAAIRLARVGGAVVIATGAIDYVTDGRREVALSGGDALATRVTATGCALSAAVAAFAGVAEDPFDAAIAALALWNAASERAAALADGGPATFRTAFLDTLARITPAEVAAATKVAP